ncbi:MAG TPA: hypothetical protein VNW29_05405 [Candidatus Sulfotelmatobacter sp.]|jgi:hypothetical protein|nr:hypothetical protein [Candidatus Sulfotelmatobacter sp.]
MTETSRYLFIALSSIITISATVPYILDIVKPRIVSWFTWTLLTGISAAASLTDHQYAAGILSLSASVECMIVVLLGLKYGDKQFAAFDIYCQISAIVGLILWFIFNTPAIAVIAGIIIDLIGSLPTLKHAWEKPAEETWITFALSSLGASFAAFAASNIRITALANPIYIITINAIFTAVLLIRHKIPRII